MRTPRRRRAQVRRMARRAAGAPDATIEADPGPPPEAVFDRVTGPNPRRAAFAMPSLLGMLPGAASREDP